MIRYGKLQIIMETGALDEKWVGKIVNSEEFKKDFQEVFVKHGIYTGVIDFTGFEEPECREALDVAKVPLN